MTDKVQDAVDRQKKSQADLAATQVLPAIGGAVLAIVGRQETLTLEALFQELRNQVRHLPETNLKWMSHAAAQAALRGGSPTPS